MTARAWLRAGSLVLAAGLLVGGAPLAAFADGPSPAPSDAAAPTAATTAAAAAVPKATTKPKATPQAKPVAKPEPAAKPKPTAAPKPEATPSAAQLRVAAEARRIAAEIVALQRTAERKGETAQKAAERANERRADADAATTALLDAQAAAGAAQQRAVQSRARASALAARLARTDLGTLPLSLLLNGRTAEGVLGGLSTTSQLTAQAQLLYQQAQADELEAARLQSVAAAAADDAEAALEQASRTAAAAKREAAAATKAVEQALAQQRTLLAGADDAAVCQAAGTAPVSVCLTDGAAPAGSSIGARVVAYALRQIGKPYVFAAAGPDAFDCSGLTLTAYATAGVSIGIHSATAQYRLAAQEGDLVPLAAASPGDLLFYTDGGGDMYHVTVYAGNGLMIEAPYPGATVREAPVRSADLVATAAHFG